MFKCYSNILTFLIQVILKKDTAKNINGSKNKIQKLLDCNIDQHHVPTDQLYVPIDQLYVPTDQLDVRTVWCGFI